MDDKVIHYLKALVLDMVQNSRSGHIGGALSSMDFAYYLFTEFLNFHPDNPLWLPRDRFILSAGHESPLLYSLLVGTGWLSLEDLKAFRQEGSRTPGHPELCPWLGMEATTGPLGQGMGMGVGLAAARAHRESFYPEFGGKTWVLVGDGCMQEGVSLSSASLAGHWKLKDLIVYYDKNAQQIGGSIHRVSGDNHEALFSSMGWAVQSIDGHDASSLRKAIRWAMEDDSHRPNLIIGHTVMGKGLLTLEGDPWTHGSLLSQEEFLGTRRKWGLDSFPNFYWPEEAREHFQRRFEELRQKASLWQTSWFPQRKDKLHVRLEDVQKPMATRVLFGKLLQETALQLEIIGGSADLEASNCTEDFKKIVGEFQSSHYKGRHMAFGARENAMGAILNGLALWDKDTVPFGGTFLVFSDYMKAEIRMSALQKLGVVYEFTHDSLWLGEDGPTHQPVEHIMGLRAIPHLRVVRPSHELEGVSLWNRVLKENYPSAWILSRQNIKPVELKDSWGSPDQGGWIIRRQKSPKICILATGSEVSLAMDVANLLNLEVQVVSLPCWELFEEAELSYQKDVLSDAPLKVSLEAGRTLGWERWVGSGGLTLGIETFGSSGSGEALAKKWSFTPEGIAEKILDAWESIKL